MTTSLTAHPPATLEGWYALHEVFRINRASLAPSELHRMVRAASAKLGDKPVRPHDLEIERKGASAPESRVELLRRADRIDVGSDGDSLS